jgi:DNA-binding NarL/FixJ family response regulator
MSRPRVVIVDDHELFRAGVKSRLEGHVDVVGEGGSVEEAVAAIRAQRPDVVLLDVHMPGGGGLAVLVEVAHELPEVRFLALSVSDAPEDVIEIVHAGARGYVTKTVETHVSAVLRKLQLSNRNQLSRWAAERRLVD